MLLLLMLSTVKVLLVRLVFFALYDYISGLKFFNVHEAPPPGSTMASREASLK